MAQQPQQPTTPIFEYVDLAELPETYADSVQAVIFDGQSVKITFAVTRFEGREGQSTPSGKRYTACRLVMPVGGAAALSDQLNKLGANIAQAKAAHDNASKTKAGRRTENILGEILARQPIGPKPD
jgi:hypothetical protein